MAEGGICLNLTFGGTAGAGGSEEESSGRRKGLLVTGSFWRRPWKPFDCLRLKPRGFSFSACECMESGRGRFSPLTLRGEGLWGGGWG